MVLIVVSVLAEVLMLLADYHIIFTPRLRMTLYEYLGFWPGLLWDWVPNYTAQPYTMFISYAFLHSGPTHLIVNMITLYSLGAAVVHRIGNKGFILLFIAAVLGGGLAFGLMARTPQPMVGASGGLFGVAGGLLAWSYVDRFTHAQTLWPIIRAIVGLLLLNLVLWWLMDGLLAWQTHLGGFVSGWLVAMLLDPRSQPADPDASSRE